MHSPSIQKSLFARGPRSYSNAVAEWTLFADQTLTELAFQWINCNIRSFRLGVPPKVSCSNMARCDVIITLFLTAFVALVPTICALAYLHTNMKARLRLPVSFPTDVFTDYFASPFTSRLGLQRHCVPQHSK